MPGVLTFVNSLFLHQQSLGLRTQTSLHCILRLCNMVFYDVLIVESLTEASLALKTLSTLNTLQQ